MLDTVDVYKGKALLSNKRKFPNINGMYMVTVTCSVCRHWDQLTYSGWDGWVCLGCRRPLKRTPYRKAVKS